MGASNHAPDAYQQTLFEDYVGRANSRMQIAEYLIGGHTKDYILKHGISEEEYDEFMEDVNRMDQGSPKTQLRAHIGQCLMDAGEERFRVESRKLLQKSLEMDVLDDAKKENNNIFVLKLDQTNEELERHNFQRVH